MTLYDRITSPALLVRRLNLSADHVIPEDQVKKEETYEQLSLFSDPSKEEAEKIQKEASRERERRLQTAMLGHQRPIWKKCDAARYRSGRRRHHYGTK